MATPLAQEPARDFAAWSANVMAHQPGEPDSAVRELETWTMSDVEGVLSDVGRLALSDRLSLVSQALVLHADVALFNRTLTGYALPPGDSTISLSADGQQMGQMVGTFHWAFCRRLIERLPRGDDRTLIARTFYRATSAVLQLWGEHVELEPHLREGLRIIGDDAVLFMYQGTMHQVSSGPRLQRVFDAQREALRETSALGFVGGAASRTIGRGAQVIASDLLPTANEARSAAERAFRRALSEDPSLAEARVRLAHVLFDRGRLDDAERELGQLPRLDESSGFLAYYTAVLAGSVARAQERLDEAEVAFSRALAIEPRAQVPRLALSELALASGRREIAVTVLEPLEVPSGSAGIDDPWWRVGRTHGASARELIDTMSRELP